MEKNTDQRIQDFITARQILKKKYEEQQSVWRRLIGVNAVAVAGGGVITTVTVQIPNDADFFWETISGTYSVGALGVPACRVNIADLGANKNLTVNPVPLWHLLTPGNLTTGNLFFPQKIEYTMARNSQIQLDFQNADPNPIVVDLTLIGKAVLA
jgi:hypothetical protein